jgi:hypothetical protein
MYTNERLIQDDADFDISFLGAGAWRNMYGFQKKAADGTALLDEWSFALKMLRDSEWYPGGSDKIEYDMKKEKANIIDRLQKKAADGTALRDAWSFALKMLRDSEWYPGGSDKIEYDMKKEKANIIDRLPSSPCIVDIYAYCGTAMIAEHMTAQTSD